MSLVWVRRRDGLSLVGVKSREDSYSLFVVSRRVTFTVRITLIVGKILVEGNSDEGVMGKL